ncbi:hypothetical protein Y032_0351g3235 [Ancylostoma ceylanicum]|uniref:Uncharacterized protein n=1 Tax=Ancylostoma ceylanicum TaxID=53326 RepID=A0A016RWQ0_9BILA|nr:hypothetical protein Y032_0351g3235 [Ancylostoma ceylanicum]
MQSRQLRTSTMHLAVEQSQSVLYNDGSKYLGDESLENEEHGRRPSDVDDDDLRAVIEADPSKPTRDVAEELDIAQSIPAFETNWKGEEAG